VLQRSSEKRQPQIWQSGPMKTTIDIPDPLFRRAKSRATERSQSLKQFVAEALREKLGVGPRKGSPAEPAWMQGFGRLRRLRKETGRIQHRIDETFESVEP
jgi:hypothetical protein